VRERDRERESSSNRLDLMDLHSITRDRNSPWHNLMEPRVNSALLLQSKRINVCKELFLTPWKRICPLKMTVIDLPKKIPGYYEIGRFIILLTAAHKWN